MIVNDLKPPYYAVIFTTLLTDNLSEYNDKAKRMEELAAQQKGYLGIEHARSEVGITISYWESQQAIVEWRNNIEHSEARKRGKEQWYKQYQLRICKVEREYGFKK